MRGDGVTPVPPPPVRRQVLGAVVLDCGGRQPQARVVIERAPRVASVELVEQPRTNLKSI